jgi:hypothetical protein
MRLYQRNLAGVIPLLAVAVLLFSCSEDTPTAPGTGGIPGYTVVTVDPVSGGTVTHENAALEIPPNALDDQTDIFAGIPDPAPAFALLDYAVPIGDIYEFGPSGAGFDPFATLSITYDPDSLSGYDENVLTIMTFQNPGDTPVALINVTVNPVFQEVSGNVDHLSYFMLMALLPPVAPQLQSPTDGSTVPYPVNLNWYPVPGASFYTLQIAMDENFSSGIFEQNGIMGTTFVAYSVTPTIPYWWRIKAVNAAGESPWSHAWTFTSN